MSTQSRPSGWTTLEESQKLLEAGLNPATADMSYITEPVKVEDSVYTDGPKVSLLSYIEACKVEKMLFHPLLSSLYSVLPCWSLAALLDVIPKCIGDYNIFRMDINDKDFSIWYDEIGCGVNNKLPDITMKEPVDACYEMILKLKELNLL